MRKYDLGFAQPGYYYIWYYADTPGRHLNVLGVSGDYSDTIVIDVYAELNPKPTPPKPDPEKECEKRGVSLVIGKMAGVIVNRLRTR